MAIRNKNIAKDAAIFPGKIMGGGMLGVGEIFYVCKTSDTSVYDWLAQRVPSGNLFPASDTAADIAINAAVSACVEGRNDYIIVMPSDSDYDLTSVITLNKKSIHLVCPAGASAYDIGANNACRLEQTTAATAVIAITDAAIEVAGFYLKPYIGCSHITLATGASGPNIHHNYFPLKWTTSNSGSIVGTGEGGAWGKIIRNCFISQAGDDETCASVISIASTATGAEISNNQLTIGDGNVATIGFSNGAVKGNTNFNIFSECGGSGASDGGTITNAISIHASGCAISNRGAVGTGQLLTGGTADHSFVDNLDGVSYYASNLEG